MEKRPELWGKYIPEEILEKFRKKYEDRIREMVRKYGKNTTLYVGIVGPKYKVRKFSAEDLDFTSLVSTKKEKVEIGLFRYYTDRWIGIIEVNL